MHMSLPLPLPFLSHITRTRTRTTSSTSICNICSTTRLDRVVSMGKLSGSRDRPSKLLTLLIYLPFPSFPLLFSYSTCVSFMICPALHCPTLPYPTQCSVLFCLAVPCPVLHCPILPYLTLPCHAMHLTALHYYDLHHHPPCCALLCSGRSVEEHTGRGGIGAGEGMGMGLGRLRSDTAKHVGNSLSYTPATGNGILLFCIMAAKIAFSASLPPVFFRHLHSLISYYKKVSKIIYDMHLL